MARGTRGVRVTATHKADNADFIFIDIDIAPDAAAGEYEIIFTRGEERFVLPYRIDSRREGSAARQSFTTADMIYLLMPDRFATATPRTTQRKIRARRPDRAGFFSRHGGDIQGMIDHLDYIASTGATAVWSTPLLLDDEPHGSYHGYACADYYHIDPRFGSNELYRTFVAESHRRGLKVIMDIVTNHCAAPTGGCATCPSRTGYTASRNIRAPTTSSPQHGPPNGIARPILRYRRAAGSTARCRHEPRQPIPAAILQAVGRMVDRICDLDGLRVDTYPYNEKEPMSEWCRAVREEYPASIS